MRRKPQTLTDQLRKAIDASEMSRYRICKVTGMSESTMSRFMAGKGGLSLDVLDKIARALGARLVVESKADEKDR